MSIAHRVSIQVCVNIIVKSQSIYILVNYIDFLTERQDSTKLKSNIVLRDNPADDTLPCSPKGLEAESESVVVAESYDKLMDHKLIKKHREKLNKKLEVELKLIAFFQTTNFPTLEKRFLLSYIFFF